MNTIRSDVFYERPGVGRCHPPAKGIVGVTRGPRDLVFPGDTPPGQQWIYQGAYPFQISPTEAGCA